jgi:hypothetical protein
MPQYMRMTRNELVWQIENSVKRGCTHRIYPFLKARGDFELYHAADQASKFAVVVSGFEEIEDESCRRFVETEGEIRVLFGNSDQGVYLKDLDLELRPFIIRVKDGRSLDNGKPAVPAVFRLGAGPTSDERSRDRRGNRRNSLLQAAHRLGGLFLVSQSYSG